MARFNLELPTEIMKDIDKVYNNADAIFGGMTKAGAEVALNNAKANAPNTKLKSHIKLSKVYKTPSDDGINTKVVITGWIPFSNPNRKYFIRSGAGGDKYSSTEGVPADFLAKLYEYGRSTSPFPKKPFFRKSFKKAQIENAMLNAQKKLSGGVLE